jgi:hypothetical protein
VVLIGGWVEKDMEHGFFGIANLPPAGGQDRIGFAPERCMMGARSRMRASPVWWDINQYIHEICCVPRLIFWCRRWCELFRIRTFDTSG